AGPWPPPQPALEELLEAVGIAHGRAFAPDPAMAALLADAAREAYAWLQAVDEAARPPWSAFGRWRAWKDPAATRGAGAPPGVTQADLRAIAALRGGALHLHEADPACL